MLFFASFFLSAFVLAFLQKLLDFYLQDSSIKFCGLVGGYINHAIPPLSQ
jgi:hypothetical protein